MTARLLVLVAVVAATALVAWAWARWRRGGPVAAIDLAGVLPEGAGLAGSAGWLVLTTPWCATCGPVADALRARGHRVALVDVAEHAEVGRALDVRTAPTLLRVEADGTVAERHAGPAAVRAALGPSPVPA